MSIKEKLMADMKAAMKAKDKIRLETIRLVRGMIRNIEIDSQSELDDDGVLDVLAKSVKMRVEAIEQYEQAGRDDLAEKEKAELTVLQEYMPQPLSEAELNAIIEESIGEAEATGMKDMGKVMQVVMPKVKGRANGKTVNQLVREKLQ